MLNVARSLGRKSRSLTNVQKRHRGSYSVFEGLGDREHDIFKFNHGAFDCTIFREDVMTMDMRTWFLGATPEQKLRYLSGYSDQLSTSDDGLDMFTLPVTFMLVKTPQNNILIDGGSGDLTELFGDSSYFKDNNRARELLESEINPEDIDHIFLTHAHIDHVGLLRKGDSAYLPNAKVVLGESELANCKAEVFDSGYAMKDPTGPPATEEEIYALVAEPQLWALDVIKDENFVTYKEPTEILPGITCTEIGGHTVGCGLIDIESGGETLRMTGDQFYHPVSLNYPELGVIFHSHPYQTTRNIKKIRDDAVDKSNILLYSCHFPHPAPSIVVSESDGSVRTVSISDFDSEQKGKYIKQEA